MSESVAAGGGPGFLERLLAENRTLRERLERREQELLAANRTMAQVLNQNVAS